MNVVVSGSRGIRDYELVAAILEGCGFHITTLIHGDAAGVDSLADFWAGQRGIPVRRFPVTAQEWDTYGNAAGPRRNATMLRHAEAVVVIWDGKSPGTRDMLQRAHVRGIPVHLRIVGDRRRDEIRLHATAEHVRGQGAAALSDQERPADPVAALVPRAT